MNIDSKIWMVRAGEGGFLIGSFLTDNIVAIGWNELGPITAEMTYNQLKDKFRKVYPDDKDGRVNQCVGQIWKFAKEFKVGDKIVTYDSSSREYYLGEIISNYDFDPALEYHHFRSVKWEDTPTYRDDLTTETKNTLGAISTIFELTNNIWLELAENNTANPSEIMEKELSDFEDAVKEFEEQENLKMLKEDVIERSKEFIKDIISNLSWQDTEALVGGLLRTLGYKTRFTSRGPDLGSDILASPDELALKEPRIKVEVKKRTKEKISAVDVRSFIGGMRDYTKGVYVTTNGFTKEAQYEAERSNFAITLIDSDRLVDLLVSNYETLDAETKSLVPLRKIYWPV